MGGIAVRGFASRAVRNWGLSGRAGQVRFPDKMMRVDEASRREGFRFGCVVRKMGLVRSRRTAGISGQDDRVDEGITPTKASRRRRHRGVRGFASGVLSGEWGLSGGAGQKRFPDKMRVDRRPLGGSCSAAGPRAGSSNGCANARSLAPLQSRHWHPTSFNLVRGRTRSSNAPHSPVVFSACN